MAAACTSAVCHYAFLTETPRSASASLSCTSASFAFAFAFAFAFSVFPSAFEVRTEETAAESPFLQKLPYLAVVNANGHSNVIADYVVNENVFGHVNAVWVSELVFNFFLFDLQIIEKILR